MVKIENSAIYFRVLKELEKWVTSDAVRKDMKDCGVAEKMVANRVKRKGRTHKSNPK